MKHTIVIVVKGGMIETVISNSEIEAVIIDKDVDEKNLAVIETEIVSNVKLLKFIRKELEQLNNST